MVVQAAIGDQKHLATRDFAVHDAADVDTGLADEVTAQFDDELGLGQVALGARLQLSQVGGDRGQVQPCFTGEIGDAEATAQVQELDGRRCGLSPGARRVRSS